jgi:hypothetical protein
VIINTSQPLEAEEQRVLADSTIAILSKETASQKVAARVREALLKAGIALEDCEGNNV